MPTDLIERLQGLEPVLKARVLGQDDAVERVSRSLEAAELGLNETGARPQGAFLFMGPTGVGKTSCCKAFSDHLFGEGQLEMIFCNELQDPGQLPELVRTLRRAVDAHPGRFTLLFDEIEKMHAALIDVLISLLDEGLVTEPGGNRFSVAGCYVVLTSNLGAGRWGQMERTLYSTMEDYAHAEARAALRHELFARLTATVVFRPLSQVTQESILAGLVERKLCHLKQRLNVFSGWPYNRRLSVDPQSVPAFLLRKGFTQMSGARYLRQTVDDHLNLATLPWALEKRCPQEGHFFADWPNNRLALR